MTVEPATTGAAGGSPAPGDEPALVITDLVKTYPIGRAVMPGRRSTVAAVDGVSLTVPRGRTLGLVGESGSGKSTLAKMLVAVERPTSGSISVFGKPIHQLAGRQLRLAHRDIQLVFQDPYTSLDPRQSVAEILGESLAIHPDLCARRQRPARIAELLDMVGLTGRTGQRLPHQLSGGQRQRVGIARALALRPQILVLDEPVSALDSSVQAQIVNLLMELQTELGLTYVFIAHDLGVVAHMSDEIAVMYLGRIVEQGSHDEVFAGAQHPYTTALLSAVPEPDPAGRAEFGSRLLSSEAPVAGRLPTGCRFRNRCWRATDICDTTEPDLLAHGPAPSHVAACHHADVEPTAPGRPAASAGPAAGG